jgi:uncharacterized RDD family membrane protein YckC
VVRTDGRPICAGQSFVSNLLYLPALLGDLNWGIIVFFAPLDDVLVLAGRRRLGDYLANTVVARYAG